MIALLHRLPVGNAVRVLLMPPPGAESWRVLRKDEDTIAGHDDPDALPVFDGDERSFLDAAGLENGAKVYYRPFYRTRGVWVAAPSVSITPAATFSDASADPQRLVRDRLELGLRVYVERGELAHDMGFVPALTAPPLLDEVRFPLVTVELTSAPDAQRAIGNAVGGDRFDPDAMEWSSAEGLLSRVQLEVTSWSLNPDERIALRRAVRTLLLGNEPVFADAGMAEIEVSAHSDLNDFESYQVPIYRAACTFSCLAPSVLDSRESAVRDVVLTMRS
jgi:hypothetical protein